MIQDSDGSRIKKMLAEMGGKLMCNGCGDMFPLDHACSSRHEGEFEFSYYHIGHEVKEKCSDCGSTEKFAEIVVNNIRQIFSFLMIEIKKTRKQENKF